MVGPIASMFLILTTVAADSPPPATIALTKTSEVRFVSSDEGRAILTADDSFTASLSRFDLQCRLKTDKDVTLADWKYFVAEHVRPWEQAEIDAITSSFERLRNRLADFRLPLPPLIRLV